MEFTMLSALNWRVNPPTALSFIRQFLDIINSLVSINSITMKNVYDLSQIQTGLALKDSRLITVPNSNIAFAALMNSLKSISTFDRQTIEFIGCHISKITGIDWYSEDFMDVEYILYANTDEGRCGKFKLNIG